MSELFNLEDHAAAEYAAAGFVVFPSCLLTAAAELASRDKARPALGCIHVYTDGPRVVAESTDSYAAARIVADDAGGSDAEPAALDILLRADTVRFLKLADGPSDYVAVRASDQVAEVHMLKRDARTEGFKSSGGLLPVGAPSYPYPLVSRLFSDLERKDADAAPVWINPARVSGIMRAVRRVDRNAPVCLYSFKSTRSNAAAEPVEFIARNEARTVEFKALLMQVIA